MSQITLVVQGFDSSYIKRTIKNILKILDFLKINNKKIFLLPSKLKKYTLERSPHIDKKSREQFEIKKYKAIIFFELKSNIIIEIFFFIIKNSINPGVQLTISIHFPNFITFSNL